MLEAGRQRIEELKIRARLGIVRSGREELITPALTALHILHADEHYLVRDGKVQIIDEFSGRICPTAPGSTACTR